MLTKKQLEIEVPRIIRFIQDYFKNAGFKKAVIGNSGGKDSAAAIGLLAKALGKENVLTVTLPCHSKDEDREDAMLVANAFGVRCINVQLDRAADEMYKAIEFGYGSKLCEESVINTKPRLRMTALYAIAQSENALVIGTGNLCELTLGYFTKFGDGASDLNFLAEFFVSDVVAIAKYIGVPEKVYSKAPSDGISGKSDEEKLKVKYSQVEEYITTGTTENEALEKIKRLERISAHKLRPIPIYHKIKDWSKYGI